MKRKVKIKSPCYHFKRLGVCAECAQKAKGKKK